MKLRLTAAQRQRLGLSDDATAPEVLAAVGRFMGRRGQSPRAATVDDELYARVYPPRTATGGERLRAELRGNPGDTDEADYQALYPDEAV
jgi:hypothetical protein